MFDVIGKNLKQSKSGEIFGFFAPDVSFVYITAW